jgi:protein-S-isoprenylcysteine O-methyltransferase Ste14
MNLASLARRVPNLRINVLRLLFIVMLPLMLFARPVWLDRAWIFATLELIGTLLLIAAVIGRFWATLYIGGRKDQVVMQDGPYSMCRHPLYFFSTLGVIGLGFMLGSVVLALLIGGLAFLVLSATAANEEARLRGKFAADYAAYARRVPRIIPDPRLFRTEPKVTVAVIDLRRNLFDALVFLSFIPVAKAVGVLKEYGAFATFPLF